ncbi:MAG TPA: NAD(P)H-dependent glycerol-3-phosphate dehydrogenase [Bryobacteraceae bacterium]|nr:NAD(P)H-dependent glycerol-3-phosphate dehydrogenase [Bryobacteraceae bacterium]
MSRLSIIGGGGWGTALACVLSPRFEQVRLWVREPDLAARICESRVNDIFLPGVTLPGNIEVETTFEPALAGVDVVISAVPSHVVREMYMGMARWLTPGMRIVSATKGLEAGTLLRMSQVIRSVVGPDYRSAVLSGPTFAVEVAKGSPTALVLASEDEPLVRDLQSYFSGPSFRVYGSRDPAGVEIGGALKNVIAIGAGISDGLGLGHNARAALITRGLAELTRLAVALGARAETLSGLAGLGDLVLTCTGDLSRNRQVGLKLAAGLGLGQILSSTPMVAEGVKTTSVAMELATRHGVDLPIAAEMHAVLNMGRSPGEAIKRLMSRSLRSEAG